MTDPNGHTTSYLLDGFGRTERLTNAKGENTELVWDADNNVIRLRENNGATNTWSYDPKTGYPLEIRDAEGNAHSHPPNRLGYSTDLDGHVADLIERGLLKAASGRSPTTSGAIFSRSPTRRERRPGPTATSRPGTPTTSSVT